VVELYHALPKVLDYPSLLSYKVLEIAQTENFIEINVTIEVTKIPLMVAIKLWK